MPVDIEAIREKLMRLSKDELVTELLAALLELSNLKHAMRGN